MLSLDKALALEVNSWYQEVECPMFDHSMAVTQFVTEDMGLAIICKPLELAFYDMIRKIITDRMVAYAAADIRGASMAHVAFNCARNDLHEWDALWEGCQFVNGKLTVKGEE